MNQMNALDRVILGDNQFFAVNHKSQEIAFTQAERFSSDEAILSLMRSARDMGIKAMMLHSHPRAEGICEIMRNEGEHWKDFYLYPCIPYAFKYVIALNEKGFYPVLVDQVKKAGVGSSLAMFLKGGLGLATRDYLRLIQILIDLEMQIYKGLNVKVVFLHNVVVDLILALGIEGLLSFFCNHIREKHSVKPGLGSLNLPLLVERMRAENIEDAVIMTAVNPIGFFMNPSKESCEEVLKEPMWNVVAMSILASGAVPAREAFPYASSLPAVRSLLFGSSRTETLKESLNIINQLNGLFST